MFPPGTTIKVLYNPDRDIEGVIPYEEDLRYRVKRVWRKWLSRRSQTAHVAWDRFALLEQRYPLPPVRLVRPLRVT